MDWLLLWSHKVTSGTAARDNLCEKGRLTPKSLLTGCPGALKPILKMTRFPEDPVF